jgi:hypothetical protein
MEARALAGRRVDAVERAGATMVRKFCKCYKCFSQDVCNHYQLNQPAEGN